jgi:hypothetical protein
MLRNTIVALAVTILAAPALAGDFCAWVEVSSPENPEGGTDGKPFSARQVLDLDIAVLLQGDVEGERLLELRLLTPRGHRYQTLTLPIATNSRSAARRQVATFPRPLDVQVLETVESRQGTARRAVLSLPVAGTAIVTSGLYGTWAVEVLLDGQPMTCELLNSFVLAE